MGRYGKRQKTRTVEVNYSIENVSKDFFVGHRSTLALDGVSLAVAAGEHLSVLGSSGAGKTTLFRLLNATCDPPEGRFAWMDAISAGCPARIAWCSTAHRHDLPAT